MDELHFSFSKSLELYKMLLRNFWLKSKAWSSDIDLKVARTEKKEEEFLAAYLEENSSCVVSRLHLF